MWWLLVLKIELYFSESQFHSSLHQPSLNNKRKQKVELVRIPELLYNWFRYTEQRFVSIKRCCKAQYGEVRLQYGNVTTKWRFYTIFGLIPLYTYLFALLRYLRHKKEVELAQPISITTLSFIKSQLKSINDDSERI